MVAVGQRVSCEALITSINPLDGFTLYNLREGYMQRFQFQVPYLVSILHRLRMVAFHHLARNAQYGTFGLRVGIHVNPLAETPRSPYGIIGDLHRAFGSRSHGRLRIFRSRAAACGAYVFYHQRLIACVGKLKIVAYGLYRLVEDAEVVASLFKFHDRLCRGCAPCQSRAYRYYDKTLFHNAILLFGEYSPPYV